MKSREQVTLHFIKECRHDEIEASCNRKVTIAYSIDFTMTLLGYGVGNARGGAHLSSMMIDDLGTATFSISMKAVIGGEGKLVGGRGAAKVSLGCRCGMARIACRGERPLVGRRR